MPCPLVPSSRRSLRQLMTLIAGVLLLAAASSTTVSYAQTLPQAPQPASPVWADPRTALQESGQQPRDYVIPGEVPPDFGKVISVSPKTKSATPLATEGVAAASYPTEETIQYRSLQGNTYTLRAYSGKYVRWAFQSSHLGAGGISQQQIYQLVSLTDLNYAHMAELLDGEPSGSGLLTIAVVELGPCCAGLGYVGAKGVDIAPMMLNDIKSFVDVGQLHGVIQHEMSHNFDIYSWPQNYLSYYGDFGHAWTEFLQHYLLFYASFGEFDLTPKAALTAHMKQYTKAWDAAGATASWEVCVRNGGGCEALGIPPNNGWSGFMLRFARLHGAAAMRRVFSYLQDYAGPLPSTPDDKNDLLVKALAYGANANILCELDTWNWGASSAARNSIAALYPSANAFCADTDLDGYSRVEGDYNDRVKTVHPGAAEVQNGVDDDCNDVVDDLKFTEAAAGDFANPLAVAPTGVISGRITANDSDSFNVNITQPRKVVFELCSEPDFQGWLFVYKSDGSWFDYQYVFAGSCSTKVYQLNEVRQWRFEVALNSSSLPGKYSVRYYTAEQWPAPWGTTAPVTVQGSAYKLSAATASLANASAAPTHVRFWVDGLGFVGTAPYAATTNFNWTPPAGLPAGTYNFRAQLLSGTTPVEAATAPQSFYAGLSISPASKAFGVDGGTGVVQVTAASGLGWTAASNAAWLTVTGGATGTGNGTVSYSVALNTSGAARTAALTIGGKTFTVTQSVLGLSILDKVVTEGNTGTLLASFQVKLSLASTKTVTVNYATANATALAGKDYQATTGKLTFAPGQTVQTINVPVIGDTLDEANEKFVVNLSVPVNASITDAQGACTITDNDALPSITITNASVTEPDAGTIAATFTIKLSAMSGRNVTVKYVTAPGTATSGIDYTAAPLTTLTIPAGQISRTVTVQVKADLAVEPNETFFVNLSGPVNATILDSQGAGTILNDD